ncbi:MAG: glycoside hydrolase family 5 protein [Bacteroidales bacterium]|nr:glycoside hydrolase family 5 protein [Bacteroidales bacterium]
MKKINYLMIALALSTLPLSSCSKDDEDPDNTENNNQNPNNGNQNGDQNINQNPNNNTTDEGKTYVCSVENAPAKMSEKLGLGWNLGNQLDAHANEVANETCWGNEATTQEAFNKIAAAGIKTVRIPVTWMGHIGGAPEYKIEEAWLNRVYEIVGYAENAGLNAIINIHHDGAESKYWLNIIKAAKITEANTSIKAKFEAIWKQIAEKFKDKGDFLIFEAVNEIQDGKWGWGANRTDGGKQYQVLNEWLNLFVKTVRATGGNNATRWLGIPAYNTDIDLAVESLKIPYDEAGKLMVAVHFYAPSEYTLSVKYSEWGHTGTDKAANSDEEMVKTQFKKLYDNYTQKNIPVYLGEFGNVCRNTDPNSKLEQFRRYYLEYVCKAAKNNSVAPILWDNGVILRDNGVIGSGEKNEKHGYFNHATGEFINDGEVMINAMLKAVNDKSEDYTLDWIYENVAPKK